MVKPVCILVIAGLLLFSGLTEGQETGLSNNDLQTPWAKQLDPENVLPEYPRPQMVRDDWINLNGWWQYESAASLDYPPFGRDLPEKILVPFCVESVLSGLQRPDTIMWYRKTFSIPQDWDGERVHLNFGAVDWEARVFLNGKYLGSHKGGHDEFSFDITQYLTDAEAGTVNAQNELIVGVIDRTSNAQAHGKQNRNPKRWSYTSVSGIWQTVWLESTPQTYISQIELVPDVNNSRLNIRLQIKGKGADRIAAVAYSDEGMAAAGNGNPGQTIVLRIPEPRLWSPDDPFLYNLTLHLMRGNETLDRVTSYFGMRSVELAYVNGIPRPMLNGQFVYQAGTLDQGYWPDGLYTAVTDEALKYDVQLHKDMGFNMVRKHVKVEPQRWYYWCDQLGLLVWQDMPHKGDVSPSANNQWEIELKEMIQEHMNSPSLIYWVIFNEMWGIYDADRITEYVRKLDPTRLIGTQSGGEDKRGYVDTGAGDARDHHTYGDDPSRQVPIPGETPNPFRFSAVGEYGGIECVVPGHSFGESTSENQRGMDEVTDVFVEMQKKFLPYIPKGLSATVYTQIVDVETEQNGLYSYDRKVSKVDVSKIRRINQKLIGEGKKQNSLPELLINEGPR